MIFMCFIFFISIGPNLANKISNQTKYPLSYLGDRLPITIFLEPVSDEEVEGIVNNLKNLAPGYDEITASIAFLYQLSEVHWLINEPVFFVGGCVSEWDESC